MAVHIDNKCYLCGKRSKEKLSFTTTNEDSDYVSPTTLKIYKILNSERFQVDYNMASFTANWENFKHRKIPYHRTCCHDKWRRYLSLNQEDGT